MAGRGPFRSAVIAACLVETMGVATVVVPHLSQNPSDVIARYAWHSGSGQQREFAGRADPGEG